MNSLLQLSLIFVLCTATYKSCTFPSTTTGLFL